MRLPSCSQRSRRHGTTQCVGPRADATQRHGSGEQRRPTGPLCNLCLPHRVQLANAERQSARVQPCHSRGLTGLARPKTAALLIVFSALALIGLEPAHAVAQSADRHTAGSNRSADAADPRTTAYRECHTDSTEVLYREHPMCQPGTAPRRPPSAIEPCPFRGGDRIAEIMRRSAECMRAKGY